MTIQAVMFDLGGVLVNVDPGRIVGIVARETGRSAEQIERTFHDPELLEPFELGRVSPQRYFEQVKARLGLSWSFEQFVRAWNGILSEEVERTMWLGRLRRHYTLLVLTNTNALHDEHMRAWPAFRQADHWIASHAVGLRKPDRGIYELALAKAGVAPQAIVYLDDIEGHIEAARGMGLTALHVRDGFDLERELRALGLRL